jgi:hypothetical protein
MTTKSSPVPSEPIYPEAAIPSRRRPSRRKPSRRKPSRRKLSRRRPSRRKPSRRRPSRRRPSRRKPSRSVNEEERIMYRYSVSQQFDSITCDKVRHYTLESLKWDKIGLSSNTPFIFFYVI